MVVYNSVFFVYFVFWYETAAYGSGGGGYGFFDFTTPKFSLPPG